MNCSFFHTKNNLVCLVNDYIPIFDIMKIKYYEFDNTLKFNIFNKSYIISIPFPLNIFSDFVIYFSKTPDIFYFLKHNGNLIENPENCIKNF